MNKPHIYSLNNGPQVADANYVLNKYFHVIRWKTDDCILDVGCGDGHVTEDLLYPLLPANMRKLVGIDVSHEMIEFAKTHHSREKLSYMQFDMGSKQLHMDLVENFNVIFSFHCFHWIQDQRQGVLNLYNMLRPGGEIFLLFLAKEEHNKVYQNLSKHKIWGEYMRDIKKFNICPYYYSEDPAKEFRNLLSQVGFDIHFCEVIDRSYTFNDIASWKKGTVAYNPYMDKMSDDLKENYLDDILSELRKLNYTLSNKKDSEGTVTIYYKIFVVHANKPERNNF